MTDKYQFAVGDGDLDWTGGNESFTSVWENVQDRLRFHKGKGFRIVVNKEDGPIRKLYEMKPQVLVRLTNEPKDTGVRIRSEKDRFTIVMRRHEVVDPLNQQLIDYYAHIKGAHYVWGGRDCSGIVVEAVRSVTGLILPHRADSIMRDPHMRQIQMGEAKMGDFLGIDADGGGTMHHIATILGRSVPKYPGGLVVWDTQPSNAPSPAGWPTAELGTGVQIRPAFGNYYDHQIVRVGRLGAINGH